MTTATEMSGTQRTNDNATHTDAESGIRWAVEALKDRRKENVENVRTVLMHLVVRHMMKKKPESARIELDEARDRLASSALHTANAYRKLRGEENEDVTKALQEVYDELGVAIIEAEEAAQFLSGDEAEGGAS